ncbi:hypothetical protein BUALT_Bualt03G0100000 [Buddleja alternifolia]|uniref:HMA domain-containing protein n=1 Tax=Buddleja alternifolia TaxID=168488 RepID=A0AAV6Y3R9_9LAMI|nr:hypothetical protein BUALT_Bualt03G0100000 [Buddleja alternifolia]
MKQKIVMNVPMHSEKVKSKAMQIAVSIQGVSSVSIGKENDELVVIGEGVDSVCLAKSLRKKFCFANIISVQEVKPPSPEPNVECCLPSCYNYWRPCPVYDSGPSNWFFM